MPALQEFPIKGVFTSPIKTLYIGSHLDAAYLERANVLENCSTWGNPKTAFSAAIRPYNYVNLLYLTYLKNVIATINYQLSTINYQLSTINYQLSIPCMIRTSHQWTRSHMRKAQLFGNLSQSIEFLRSPIFPDREML
jgi:hypothetical protein